MRDAGVGVLVFYREHAMDCCGIFFLLLIAAVALGKGLAALLRSGRRD